MPVRKKSSSKAIVLATAAIIVAFSAISRADEVLASRKVRITPTVRAIDRVLQSIVNLSTQTKVVGETYGERNAGDNDFIIGSGTIIDSSGLVVTNSHVVRRAARINVRLADGRKFTARELASDSQNDLALLQIEPPPGKDSLRVIPLAVPGDLMLGETVITVGNPYGLGSTISRGVLSAVGRRVTEDGKVIFSDLLQTDAPIYPGGSGGPLINLAGEMIGVTAAIHREAKGIGFAIPLTRVLNVLAGWMVPERFNNAELGIVPAVKVHGPGSAEIYLAAVVHESPAWRAGLRNGDIIAGFNGKKAENLLDMSRYLCKLKAGSTIELTLKNGHKYHVKLKQLKWTDGKTAARVKLGVGLQKLTKPLAKALGYPFYGGIIVSDILSGNEYIQRGDILARLGDQPILSFADVAKALHGTKPGQRINACLIAIKKGRRISRLIKKETVITIK